MLQRVRRASQQLSLKRKDSGVHSPTTNSHDLSKTYPKTSLLGLPPEIRNEIYEHLALDTTLTLAPSKNRKRPVPVGLILACWQTHHEYRSLLLSLAAIHIQVHDYDFNNLMRVLDKQREIDQVALKDNPQLWINLHLAHVPSRDDRTGLANWCTYRTDSTFRWTYYGRKLRPPIDELIFQYDVRFLNHMRPPRPSNRYTNGYQMKLDLLRSHLRMFRNLQSTADDPAQEELKQVLENMEACGKILEDLQKEMSERSVRRFSQPLIQALRDLT